MGDGSIASELRAWTPDHLLTAYEGGRRDFRAVNLLRDELEAVYAKSGTTFRYSDHPDFELCNPLWLDRTGSRDDFAWDSYGRCLFDEYQDLPEPRDLKGRNLTGIDLRGSYLYPIDFTASCLKGANLSRCIFLDCDMSSVDMSRADLRDARLHNCVLEGAMFYMARMDRCRIYGPNARATSFERAKLKKAVLAGLDLRGATFRFAHFDRTVLNESDLRGVDLSTTRLRNSIVDGVTISAGQRRHLLRALDVTIKSSRDAE